MAKKMNAGFAAYLAKKKGTATKGTKKVKAVKTKVVKKVTEKKKLNPGLAAFLAKKKKKK